MLEKFPFQFLYQHYHHWGALEQGLKTPKAPEELLSGQQLRLWLYWTASKRGCVYLSVNGASNKMTALLSAKRPWLSKAFKNFIPHLKSSLCGGSFTFHFIIGTCGNRPPRWIPTSRFAESCMMMCFEKEATEGGNSKSVIYVSCLKPLSHVAPTAIHKTEQ